MHLSVRQRADLISLKNRLKRCIDNGGSSMEDLFALLTLRVILSWLNGSLEVPSFRDANTLLEQPRSLELLLAQAKLELERDLDPVREDMKRLRPERVSQWRHPEA